jgi:large subunit ribosomal protein L30
MSEQEKSNDKNLVTNDNTKNNNKEFIVVRVRGLIRVKKEINYTMQILSLYRKNYCTFVKYKDLGMIKKVKDYVTYGEISPELKKELIEKKSEKTKTKDGKDTIKKFFRLNPPRKGFGKKGIKVAFSKGGALGYRADKINDLIKRMI